MSVDQEMNLCLSLVAIAMPPLDPVHQESTTLSAGQLGFCSGI